MNPLSFLTGPWGYVASALGAAALAIWLTVDIKDHEIDGMKLAQAQAVEDAWKIGWLRRDATEAVTVKANNSNAVDQATIAANTQGVIQYVPKYITVHDDAACRLPPGFSRLLDSALLGVAPDQLPPDASEPVGPAATLTLSRAVPVLAQSLGDYAATRARLLNAKQEREDQEKASKVVPPEKPGWFQRNNPF